MVLDKADRRKKDDELKDEIDELKKMRNNDQAEIKLLKVELLKMQGISKKYQDSGAMKQSAEDANLVGLPDRYVRYVQNKKRAKMYGQEMQAYL